MNSLLRCLIITPVLAGLVGCPPTPEPPASRPTVNTASTSTDPVTASASMSTEEQAVVAKLQWVNTAEPQIDAKNELMHAQKENRKPLIIVFAGRGLSYPGLSKEQLQLIRRQVNDNIIEGSGDTIYGPTHRELRHKLRTYAITYNQVIADAFNAR